MTMTVVRGCRCAGSARPAPTGSSGGKPDPPRSKSRQRERGTRGGSRTLERPTDRQRENRPDLLMLALQECHRRDVATAGIDIAPIADMPVVEVEDLEIDLHPAHILQLDKGA